MECHKKKFISLGSDFFYYLEGNMQKKYVLTTGTAVLVIAAAAFGAFKVYAEKNAGVAARVNGEVISIEDIKKGYEANPQIAAQVPFEQFYPKAVDIYVNGALLYQAASTAKVQETPEYKEQLKTAEEDLARKVYLEQIIKEKVNEAAVKEVYDNTYLKNFESKKEAKAKHILVSDEKTANDIIAKLNKGGDFDKLAEEYTKDSSVELGYFSEDIMVPEFTKAAFALKKGEYTKKPVKTQFGYHIILTEDFRDSQPLPLQDVEPQIRNMLTQKVVAETFDGLYKNGKIEKYDLEGKKLPQPEPVKE